MPRRLETVMRVAGPFLGVNENVTGDIQPPEYAETMKNIVLNRGMIEARPGLRNVLQIPDSLEDPLKPWVNAIAPLPHAFLEEDNGGTLTGKYISNARLLIVTSALPTRHVESTLYVTKPYERDVDPQAHVGTMPELSREGRGDIVHLGDKSFIAFPEWDRPRVAKWASDPNALTVPSGDKDLKAAGFDLITEAHSVTPIDSVRIDEHGQEVPDPDNEFPPGRYAFAVTLYDEHNGTESNGDYKYGDPSAIRFIDVLSMKKLRFEVTFAHPNTNPNTSRVSHVRVYAVIERLDEDPDGLEAGGETGYRLIAEVRLDARPTGTPAITQFDLGRPDMRIVPIVSGAQALSFRGIGPYIPTRNGPPPKSNAIVVYDNKVCYASVEEGSYGVLFYSADGNGEHVAADAFISFDDEGSEPITGLIVYQGRLIVFKETGIYVIAGTLTQMSNDDVALGNPAPQPLFTKYRVQGATGCHNTTGGSVALKECDGVLYYNVLDGIYGFDGLKAQKVSDPINKTHALIPEASRGSCSMANDRRNGLLWIQYAHVTDKVFCFDYRKGVGDPSVGNWTIHQFPDALSLIADVPSAVCPVLSSDPLILAGTGDESERSGRLLEMLEAYRGIDQTRYGDDEYFPWAYATPWMSLGLLDRSKRVHTVTLFFGPGADTRSRLGEPRGRFQFSVRVEQLRDRGVAVRTARSSAPGPGFRDPPVVYPLADATNKPLLKLAVNKRGTRIKLVLASTDLVNERCVGPFTGFTIDAEPIGRR